MPCVSGSVCLCMYVHVNDIVSGKVEMWQKDNSDNVCFMPQSSVHAMFLKYNNMLLTWKAWKLGVQFSC